MTEIIQTRGVAVVYEVRNVNKFLADMTRVSSAGGKAQQAATKSTQATVRALASQFKGLSGTGRSFFDGWGDGIKNLGNGFRRLSQDLSVIGAGLTGFLTFPLFNFGKQALEQGRLFEREMLKVRNLAVEVGGDVELAAKTVEYWSQSILRLAGDLGTGPQELAEGIYFIASAGIRDASEALDILTQATKGARIGLGEVADVAKATTAIMNAYGSEVYSATEATDLIAATVKEGQVESDALANSLGRVLGPASAMGVAFEDVAAYIALFTRSGESAERSATSVASILNNLLKPSAKAKEALEAYGFSVLGVLDKIKGPGGLTETLIELGTVMSKQDFALLFEQRGLRGAQFNLENADEYRKILDAISNSTGIVDEGFGRLQNSLDFQLSRLKAQWESLSIILYQQLEPALGAAARKLSDFVQQAIDVAAVNPLFVQIVAGFAAILASIGPATLALGIFTRQFSTAFTVFGGLLNGFGSTLGLVASGARGLIGVFSLVTRSVTLLGGAIGIGGLTSALIGLPLAFAAAGIGAGILSNKMTEAFDGAKSAAKDGLSSLMPTMREYGQNISEQFGKGIIDGAIAVVEALTYLGQIITFWLQPGSPPRLLPDLSRWGSGAMEAWLAGWKEADFDIFNDLASTIESFLNTMLPTESLENQLGIVEQMIGTRSDIVDAINAVKQAGKVTDQVLGSILDNLAASTVELRDYLRTTLEVIVATQRHEAAQKRLNAIQEKYDAALSPIQKRLKEIEAIQAKEQANERLKELQSIISDARAPEEVRNRARLEIEQIRLQQQEADLTAERDEALEAAQKQVTLAEEALALAEEQAALAEARLGLQQDQFALLKEFKDLLKQMLEELEGAKEELKGIKEKVGEGFTKSPGEGFTIQGPENFGAPKFEFDNVNEQIGKVDEKIKNLLKSLETLKATWEGVFTALTGAVVTWWEEKVQPIIDEVTPAFEALWTIMEESGTIVYDAFVRLKEAVGELTEELGINISWSGILRGVLTVLAIIIGAVTTAIVATIEVDILLINLLRRLVTWVRSVWNQFVTWFNKTKDVKEETQKTKDEVGGFIGKIEELDTWLKDKLTKALQDAADWFNRMGEKVKDQFEPLQKFLDYLTNIWSLIQQVAGWAPSDDQTGQGGETQSTNTATPRTIDINPTPMPSISMQMQTQAAANVGGVTIGPNYINNGMDLAEFETNLARVLNR